MILLVERLQTSELNRVWQNWQSQSLRPRVVLIILRDWDVQMLGREGQISAQSTFAGHPGKWAKDIQQVSKKVRCNGDAVRGVQSLIYSG